MTRRSRYDNCCWENRTTLEILLIIIIIIAIALLLTLSVLILTRKSSIDNKICITPECISEASTILEEIDPNENLCNEFYKFSCKNIFEHDSIQKNLDRELVELYLSPLQEEEHRAIKHVKKVFQSCMTDKETDDDIIITVKKLISRLGGWPMLDGHNWDEKKFNWLQATYKLRDLGYPSGMFLDLTVDFDPENNNKLIYNISIPHKDYWINNLVYLKSKNLEKKFAGKFKINFRNFKDELSEVISLMEQLKRLNYANVNFTNYERVKVSDFYQNYNFINWKEYIRNIVSPVEISENDVVLFSQPNIIDKWLKLLLATPKRTLANHMMLTLIEKTVPHFTKELQSGAGNGPENRLKLCLKTAHGIFTPSPINVMYARKYMSSDLQKPALTIVNNIISSLMKEARNINWLSKQNISAIIKKLSDMVVIIGAPDNYMDDKLLSQFQFAESEDNSLLNLLAVANKAQITKNYSDINKTRKQLTLEKWFLGDSTDYDFYDEQNNILRIPITIMVPSMLYKDNLLKSLNYAVLGTGVAYKLTNIFREFLNTTEHHIPYISSCKIENLNLSEKFYFQEVFRTQMSLKIAYSAYKNSIESSEAEEQLIGVEYNLNQLFWIKAATTFCKNIKFYSISNCRFYVTYGIMQNLHFTSDFKCEKLRIDYDVLC